MMYQISVTHSLTSELLQLPDGVFTHYTSSGQFINQNNRKNRFGIMVGFQTKSKTTKLPSQVLHNE